MITSKGLQQLGFISQEDYRLQNDGDGVFISEWNSKKEKPTEEEIEKAHNEWKKDYDSKQYQRDREAEYPTIQELVVALYDTDDKAAIEAKRAEVKKKYPKP